MRKSRLCTARWPFLALPLLAPLLAPLLLPLSALPVAAGPVDYDAGLRASIYDDNYKLGVGGELGAVAGLNPNWDIGLHLNYSHFAPKTETWSAADEFGGYLAAYFVPAIDQGFTLRVGPHVGMSKIRKPFVDLGGDLMAVFQVMPTTRFYASFTPSFFIATNSQSDSQSLFRVGFGVEYRPGG